ncbi:hypothetical protein ACJX0J_013267, partial [Zea mays]
HKLVFFSFTDYIGATGTGGKKDMGIGDIEKECQMDIDDFSPSFLFCVPKTHLFMPNSLEKVKITRMFKKCYTFSECKTNVESTMPDHERDVMGQACMFTF